MLRETLPSVFVLNLYEIALLAVLVLIFVKKSAANDSILLLILISIFMIGTGLTLSTICLTAPNLCLFIGIVCVMLGIGKIEVLRRYIKLRIGWLTFAGLGLVLMWNFLASPLMSRAFVVNDCTDEVRRSQWMLSWMVLLAGAALIAADAVKVKASEYAKQTVSRPFIHTHAMVWILSLIILGGACYHQYASGYMFHIPTGGIDYVPLAALVTILSIELLRSLGKKFGFVEIVLACIPFVLTLWAILEKQVTNIGNVRSDIISHPPVMFAAFGIALCALAYLHKQSRLYYAAILYALGVLLTFNYTTAKPWDLNWELFGGGLFVIAMTVGIIRKEPLACFASVVILAAGLSLTDRLAGFAGAHDMTVGGVVFAIVGIGTIMISLIFGKNTRRVLVVLGAFCVMVAIFDYMPKALQAKDIAISTGSIMMASALWLRTKDFIAAPMLCIPMLPKCVLLWQNMSSWAFVILSFVLLFAGAGASLLIRKNPAHEVIESDEQKPN
jgi:hypothetical protein